MGKILHNRPIDFLSAITCSRALPEAANIEKQSNRGYLRVQNRKCKVEKMIYMVYVTDLVQTEQLKANVHLYDNILTTSCRLFKILSRESITS
jgi:hypothetical protein